MSLLLLKPDQFFPKWAAILDQLSFINCDRRSNQFIDEMIEINKRIQDNKLNMMNLKFCMVGETYGFSDEYEKCDVCCKFSAGGGYNGLPSFPQFYNSLKDGEIKDWRNHEMIQQYLEHIQTHKDLL